MLLKKHHIMFPIHNYDNDVSERRQQSHHGEFLPDSIRCVICGPSNCGKTNLLLNLLINPHGVKFKNLYIYSKSLHQHKYNYLKSVISLIPDIGYHEFLDNENVIPCNEAKDYSIFIFDDIACEKQNNVRDFFSMGRHNNVDSFYLSQSYAKIPKHLIRDNTNLIVLYKQDEKNLHHVFDDHVSTDMDYKQFIKICRLCWKEKYDFLLIDKDRESNNGRYRRGLDTFISLY